MRPHVEPPPAHHAIPGFLRHIPCTSLNSSFSLLSDSLCLNDSVLYVFILASPAKVLSILASPAKVLPIRSRKFILTWFCRLTLPNKQRISRTTSHVSVSFNIPKQDVEFSTLNFQRFLDRHSWLIFYHQFCFNDHRFPGVTQDLSCPTSASHNSILCNV